MSFKHRIRVAANVFLNRLGFEIRRLPPVRELDKQTSLTLLKQAGILPETVFDVGVHRRGTPDLYAVFPDAKLVLIEPVEEFEQDILSWSRTFPDAVYLKAAASRISGTFSLAIRENLESSRILMEPDPYFSKENQYSVRVVTLDEVAKEYRLAPPFLIKIDVDGTDLDVVAGACDVLKQTDCIIIESGIFRLRETMVHIEEKDFFLWDIVDLAYKANVLYQFDLVFVHKKYHDSIKVRTWIDPEILAAPLQQARIHY